MYSIIIFKGIIIGFLIATIIGPISILCIPRSINEGFFSGVANGVGVALSDSIFAAFALFGITVVSGFFFFHSPFLSLTGGIFLVYNACRIFFTKHIVTSGSHVAISARRLLYIFFLAFIMSLTNPANILSFVFVFSGFQVNFGGVLANLILILGIFLGSSLFGVLLSYLGIILKCEVRSMNFITWINRIVGIVVFAFGIAMVANSLIHI